MAIILWLNVFLGLTNTKCNRDLVFEDEFNIPQIDLANWKHDITCGGGGNNEFQCYTNSIENSFIKDGTMYLKPTLTIDRYQNIDKDKFTLDLGKDCNNKLFDGCSKTNNFVNEIMINPVQSALLRLNKPLRYGKIDVRARLPKGDWLWPAIWMLPKHNVYGEWPISGEIDIMEGFGNQILNNEEKSSQYNNTRNFISSTLHFGTSSESDRYNITTNTIDLRKIDKDNKAEDRYHTYSLLWTDKYIETYIDDTIVLKVEYKNGFFDIAKYHPQQTINPWTLNHINNVGKGAPFNQEFYLIINLAVGGTNYYFNDKTKNKPWLNNQDKRGAYHFWKNRPTWLSSWNNKQDELLSAFAIDYVKVWSDCVENR